MDDNPRASRPEVPGYRLARVLGTGSGGPVWSAVREDDGLPVAVKLIDRARSTELAVLRGVEHPHVVRLVADIALADGRLALVLERVDGGSLARVAAARGHLTPGESVTVVTTLGTALADLHRIGVTHGDLSPGNVLFHADGRPMLADLGVAGIAGLADRWASGTPGFTDPVVFGGERPGPAADVYALAALGWFCLVGTPPPHPALRPPLSEACSFVPAALAEAIDAALGPDPEHRIDAAELAWRVYDAVPPSPVALAGGVDPATELTRRIRAQAVAEPSRPERQRRRPSRRARATARVLGNRMRAIRTALAVAVVVGVVFAVGLVLVRPSASATPNWTAVVAELSAARAAAFADPQRGPAGFDVPGSRAWRQDQAALDRLRASATRYEHLTITLASLRVVSIADDRDTLRVAVGTSAYDVVGAGSHREPPGVVEEVVLSLRRVGDGWRVLSVDPT